jgi:arginine/ornithine N-succinyltransferase beta subunit
VTTDERWGRVADAILASPVARAAYDGQEPPELASLVEKVRHHAYRIVDADVEGLDPDVVIEAALGAALGVALAERARALEAIE